MTAQARSNFLHFLANSLVAFFVFTIPNNLFIKWVTPEAYVRGLLIDYLIPKVYLSDIVIFFMLLLLISQINFKKIINSLNFKTALHSPKIAPITFVLLFSGIQILFSNTPIATAWFLIQIVLAALVVLFMMQFEPYIAKKTILYSLSFTILFQSLLGWYQYLEERSLFGFWFFGEPNLTQYSGIAKTSFGTIERVLAYGTTAHPNVLAGTLTLLWYCYFLLSKKNHWSIGILGFVVISIIFLTESMTGGLLFVGIISSIIWRKQLEKVLTKHAKKLIAFFILCLCVGIPLVLQFSERILIVDESFSRRIALNDIALDLFMKKPLTGSGLNSFTASFEQVEKIDEVVRFVQPAHNVAYLLLAETGILGVLLLLFLYSISTIKDRSIILFLMVLLLPVLALDHYLITLHTGRLSIALIVGVLLLLRKNELTNRPISHPKVEKD
ncbi:MAG: O-antigen ligase family protein [Microgenomates group bacterium]